ncbi:hypothetical protein GLW04_08685 [Halobacillus litoralis]|uniref:Uncharacterized protein n=1 Tax=Halobacillus litoralis TaxID=45668 RepID=A0A845DR37_9BACI|nr:hypothetical protein [Halobacillus litoralis]MYL19960.1 hypothetical protein [Halobacillus litoralis]
MNSIKKHFMGITFLLLGLTLLVNPQVTNASGLSGAEPEINFTPEVVNTYEDEDGNIVNEYSKLPDKFVTDENGNIIAEGEDADPNNVESNSNNNSGSIGSLSCGYQYYYDVVGRTNMEYHAFIDYHPGFSEARYNIKEYNFTLSSLSYSIGISGYGGSAEVSLNTPGYGYTIDGAELKWTRPAVYGTVVKETVKRTRTGGCSGGEEVTYQTRYVVDDSYIGVREWSYNPN